MTIDGPVHTNGNLDLGVARDSGAKLLLKSPVSYSGTKDTIGSYVYSNNPGDPVTPLKLQDPMIPVPNDMQTVLNDPTYTVSTSNAYKNVQDDYRELLEQPAPGSSADPTAPVYDPPAVSQARFYNQASLKITVTTSGTTTTVNALGNDNKPVSSKVLTDIKNALSPRTALYNYREGTDTQVTNIDMGKFQNVVTDMGATFNGIVYFTDASSGGEQAARLVNGSTLPRWTTLGGDPGGFTFATDKGLYLQGDFNKTNSIPSSVLADAVTVLSNNWNDANANKLVQDYTKRPAMDTTIITSIMAGTVVKDPNTGNPVDDGGANNFIRLMEDWYHGSPSASSTLTFKGSIAQLFNSQVFTGKWLNNYTYARPKRVWSFDTNITQNPPPGLFANVSFLRGPWIRY